MAEDTAKRGADKGFSDSDHLRLRTAEALEDAARRLRSTEISGNSEDIRDILHGVQDQVDQFREEIGRKYQEMEADLQSAVEPVENIICDHPIPAVLVAMGFGFLLGMLIGRSRD